MDPQQQWLLVILSLLIKILVNFIINAPTIYEYYSMLYLSGTVIVFQMITNLVW